MSPVIPTPPLAVPRQGNRRGVGNRTTLGYPATAILSALWLVFTAIAFLTFSQDQKRSGSWGCEMSYMWPSYQRIEWQGATNSRYALYLYREAGWDSGVVRLQLFLLSAVADVVLCSHRVRRSSLSQVMPDPTNKCGLLRHLHRDSFMAMEEQVQDVQSGSSLLTSSLVCHRTSVLQWCN